MSSKKGRHVGRDDSEEDLLSNIDSRNSKADQTDENRTEYDDTISPDPVQQIETPYSGTEHPSTDVNIHPNYEATSTSESEEEFLNIDNNCHRDQVECSSATDSEFPSTSEIVSLSDISIGNLSTQNSRETSAMSVSTEEELQSSTHMIKIADSTDLFSGQNSFLRRICSEASIANCQSRAKVFGPVHLSRSDDSLKLVPPFRIPKGIKLNTDEYGFPVSSVTSSLSTSSDSRNRNDAGVLNMLSDMKERLLKMLDESEKRMTPERIATLPNPDENIRKFLPIPDDDMPRNYLEDETSYRFVEYENIDTNDDNCSDGDFLEEEFWNVGEEIDYILATSMDHETEQEREIYLDALPNIFHDTHGDLDIEKSFTDQELMHLEQEIMQEYTEDVSENDGIGADTERDNRPVLKRDIYADDYLDQLQELLEKYR